MENKLFQIHTRGGPSQKYLSLRFDLSQESDLSASLDFE